VCTVRRCSTRPWPTTRCGVMLSAGRTAIRECSAPACGSARTMTWSSIRT